MHSINVLLGFLIEKKRQMKWIVTEYHAAGADLNLKVPVINTGVVGADIFTSEP